MWSNGPGHRTLSSWGTATGTQRVRVSTAGAESRCSTTCTTVSWDTISRDWQTPLLTKQTRNWPATAPRRFPAERSHASGQPHCVWGAVWVGCSATPTKRLRHRRRAETEGGRAVHSRFFKYGGAWRRLATSAPLKQAKPRSGREGATLCNCYWRTAPPAATCED